MPLAYLTVDFGFTDRATLTVDLSVIHRQEDRRLADHARPGIAPRLNLLRLSRPFRLADGGLRRTRAVAGCI